MKNAALRKRSRVKAPELVGDDHEHMTILLGIGFVNGSER